MHKKLHIWFYEWLAFIVNFYIIVVGMYFIEYMKLNLVLNDRILVLLNVLTRTDCLRWFVTAMHARTNRNHSMSRFNTLYVSMILFSHKIMNGIKNIF